MKSRKEELAIAGEPKIYLISDIVRITHSSPSTIYNKIRDGDLVVHKLGGKTVIFHKELMAWLERLPAKPAMSASHSVRLKASWKARREAEAQAR